MRYTVDHLLVGDAKAYHASLTRELSRRYRVSPLHEKMEPHITIKAPFIANDYEIAQLEATLERFTRERKPENLLLEGFGHFGHKTVYMDVVKSRGAVNLARDFLFELESLPWLTWMPHEGTKLHASVARFMTHRQYRRVWRHVKKERSRFKQSIESLAIMKKEKGQKAWEVHKEFRLIGVSEKPRNTLIPTLSPAV